MDINSENSLKYIYRVRHGYLLEIGMLWANAWLFLGMLPNTDMFPPQIYVSIPSP